MAHLLLKADGTWEKVLPLVSWRAEQQIANAIYRLSRAVREARAR